MKVKKVFGAVLGLTLLVTLSGATVVSTATPVPVPAVSGDRLAQQAIIIDHTCTDLSKVPDYWLEEAKKLAVHYAHTSHGSQIMSGLQALEAADPKYDRSVFYASSSPPSSLNCDPGTLCIYDGNPPDTYITPDLYWEEEYGRNRTRAVADTGLFDYSMWSWCGQQSYYSTAQVQLYLDTMAGFESEYPNMRFILMTGHTDGGSATLAQNNNMVRQYAQDNGMVLFDFADIETYDPLGGGPYDNNSEGTCTWCADFCTNHPAYCTNLPGSCAHSDSLPNAALFCKLKGQAFWWMMARLAGWDGTPASAPQKTASITTPVYGQTVTYTIVTQRFPAAPDATVTLTDVVPTGLSYVPGTLVATSGAWDDSAAPTLHWSGILSPTSIVTITYAVTVSTANPEVLTNTATVAAPGQQPLTCAETVCVNCYTLCLPLVVRNAN